MGRSALEKAVLHRSSGNLANGESELYRWRDISELRLIKDRHGRQAFNNNAIRSMLFKGDFRYNKKFQLAELIDHALKGYSSEQKKRILGYVEREFGKKYPKVMGYILERKEHYGILRQRKPVKYPIQFPEEIRLDALHSPLYLRPEVIAKEAGLSLEEIDAFASEGIDSLPCGPGNRHALNLVALIPHIASIPEKQLPKKAQVAVNLYNTYFEIRRRSFSDGEDDMLQDED